MTREPTHHWVRIVPPGVDAPRHRIKNDMAPLLSRPITACLKRVRGLGGIEILSYLGTAHQEVCMQPLIGQNADARSVAAQLASMYEGDAVVNDKPVTSALGTYVAATLPNIIGVGIVSADLSPLTTRPIPTERLVGQTSSPVSFARSPVDVYLEQLAQRPSPHLVRLRIQRTEQSHYALTMHVGTFSATRRRHSQTDLTIDDNDYPSLAKAQDWLETGCPDSPLSDDVVVAIMQADRPHDLAAICANAPVTTNLSLLRGSCWSLRTPRNSLNKWELAVDTYGKTDQQLAQTRAAWLVALSRHEYRRLIGRSSTASQLQRAYRQLGVCPYFILPETGLASVLMSDPYYTGLAQHDWERPQLSTVATIRQARLTEH